MAWFAGRAPLVAKAVTTVPPTVTPAPKCRSSGFVMVNRRLELVSVNAAFTFTEAGNCPVVIADDERVPSGVPAHVIVCVGVLAHASPEPETSTLPQAPAVTIAAASAEAARIARCSRTLTPNRSDRTFGRLTTATLAT